MFHQSYHFFLGICNGSADFIFRGAVFFSEGPKAFLISLRLAVFRCKVEANSLWHVPKISPQERSSGFLFQGHFPLSDLWSYTVGFLLQLRD